MRRYIYEPKYMVIMGILSVSLGLPGPASGNTLFDNLNYGNSLNFTGIDGLTWGAQSFVTDGNNDLLTKVVLPLEGASVGGTVTVALFANSASNLPLANSGVILGTIPDGSILSTGFNNQIINVSSLALNPNTEYWIVLEGASAVAVDAYWERENGATNGTGLSGQYIAQSSNAGAAWSSHALNSDFQPYVMEVDVTTAGTPEPGTLLIGVIGLAVIGAARRYDQSRVR